MDLDRELDRIHENYREVTWLPEKFFPPSEYYRFLGYACKHLNVDVAVELGVCGGGAGYYMAEKSPHTLVVGVDFQWDHADNIEYIREKCKNYDFWIGDSIRAAGPIHERLGDIGLLFVDTVHTTERATAEFKAWKDYMSDYGIIVFDDLFRKEMDGLWGALPGKKKRFDKVHDGSPGNDGGFGVIWDFK